MIQFGNKTGGRPGAWAGVWLCLLALPAWGQIPLAEDGQLSVSGSSTFRYEYQDSTVAGAFKQERLRLSARVDGRWEVRENWTFSSGVRTGSLENQQTPTVTIKTLDSRSGYGSRAVYVDRWEAGWQQANNRVLIGRTMWPFWAATDAVWDRDAHPAGLFASHRHPSGEAAHTFAAAYYWLPDGGLRFTGRMATVQLRREEPLGKGRLSYALQWLHMEGEPHARHARARANERDYRIAQVSLTYAVKWVGQPAVFGLDVFHNFKTYPADGLDTFAAAFRDERTGFALAFSIGRNRTRGDWRFRYHYVYQAALSVNPALNADTRFHVRTSNYRGHDLRFTYSLSDRWTLSPRALFAKEIVGNIRGQRYRLDLSFVF